MSQLYSDGMPGYMDFKSKPRHPYRGLKACRGFTVTGCRVTCEKHNRNVARHRENDLLGFAFNCLSDAGKKKPEKC